MSKTQLVTHHPGDVVKAGCFSVEFIHVNHSIADAVAFAIHTPVGTVIMTGDFKIDPTSEDGMTDLGRFGMLGKEGVYALLCDSTNVERQGYTPSESVVSESLDRHFKGCKNRIIVTTFASNMHRIQAVFNIAHRHGRKVAVTGRSMENILKVATELDYLHLPENTLVDLPLRAAHHTGQLTLGLHFAAAEALTHRHFLRHGTSPPILLWKGPRPFKKTI